VRNFRDRSAAARARIGYGMADAAGRRDGGAGDMKAVFVLFDSLNRHMLGCYGGTRVPTPHFDRLAARCVRFDNHHVGSLPCMPARRDLLTGRLSFLHRSWGPLEPFDDAFPEILAKQAGTYSHLVTDHFHYWEDGGATYHTRYDSRDFIRGQEGDAWKAMVQPHWDRLREKYHAKQFSADRREKRTANIINREFIRAEADFPSAQCMAAGLDFLAMNGAADNWILQIETFDPHEPFHAPARFREPFPTDYRGPVLDWPRYGRVDELPEECAELRANYYATIAHCDALLGRLLDAFDAQDLWKDTALVVTTDHGFLLGEHDFWAKNRMNLYREVEHIPLLVHDPRAPAKPGESCDALTQTTDLAATFLDLFGVAPTPLMEGIPLGVSRAGGNRREALLFGYFGGAVNVTDGRFTYHRYPPDLRTQEIYQYTVMPTHIMMPFTVEELALVQLAGPLPFTKGAKVMQVPVLERSPFQTRYGPLALLEDETRLYDTQADPGQERPLADPAQEARLAALMARLMAANHAPPEAFARLGLAPP
jgi:arylsulfatase A-like enzyme